jgi:hypothetical protein
LAETFTIEIQPGDDIELSLDGLGSYVSAVSDVLDVIEGRETTFPPLEVPIFEGEQG